MADAGFKICGAILERSGVDQSKIWSFLTNLIKNWKHFEEIEKKKIPPNRYAPSLRYAQLIFWEFAPSGFSGVRSKTPLPSEKNTKILTPGLMLFASSLKLLVSRQILFMNGALHFSRFI